MLLQKLFLLSAIFIFQGCSKSHFFNGNPKSGSDKSPPPPAADTNENPDSMSDQIQNGPKTDNLEERSSDAIPSSGKLISSMDIEYRGLTKRSETIEFDSKTIKLSQLNSLSPTVSESFHQINRTQGEKKIMFPYNGTMASESFSKNNLGIADIVLVIDNSPSMREIQEKVAGKLSTLISYFGEADWALKLVTTDATQACDQFDIFTANTPDYNQLFFDSLLSVGVLGSINERGVYKASKALKCESGADQSSWLRANSNIAVIFVSDEDNCSTGTCFGKDEDPENDPNALLTLLESSLGNSQRTLKYSAKTYGIISIPGVDCDASNVNGGATEYQNLIAQTSTGSMANGQLNEIEDICATDYTAVFNRISKDISENLQKVFTLKHTPDLYSLKLMVNNIELSLNTDFEIQGNQILFKNELPDLAEIKIDYSHGSTTPGLNIQLSDHEVSVESIEMKLAGGSVHSPDYIIANGIVTLDQTPSFDSELYIMFRDTLPALKNRFKLTNTVLNPETIVAFEDLNPVAISWDAATNEVIFEQPPTDNKNLEVRYQTTIDVTNELTIPDTIDISKIRSLTLKGPSTEKMLPFFPDSRTVRLDLTDVSEPESLELVIEITHNDSNIVHKLAEKPFLSNLVVTIIHADDSEEICENIKFINEEQPGFTINCPVTASDRVVAHYFKKNSTPVEIKTGFRNSEALKWSLYINNKKFDDWTRDGDRITISPENLGIIALIRIETHSE